MKLDFANGDTLPADFATNHKWGDIVINNELQYYRPSQIEQRPDALYLVGEPQTDRTWLSGLIGTNGTDWITKHDSPWEVEAEIKIPPGPGLLPAFWGRPTYRRGGEPGVLVELDAMESPMDGTVVKTGLHTRMAEDNRTVLEFLTKRSCDQIIATDWNFYGIRYDGEYYTFTFNHEPTHRIKVPLDHEGRDWYWILNCAIGGSYPGNPTVDTPMPVEMGIRSLRVEQTVNGNQDVVDRIDRFESDAIDCIKAASDRQRLELL